MLKVFENFIEKEEEGDRYEKNITSPLIFFIIIDKKNEPHTDNVFDLITGFYCIGCPIISEKKAINFLTSLKNNNKESKDNFLIKKFKIETTEI
jgi:hypothetical protein